MERNGWKGGKTLPPVPVTAFQWNGLIYKGFLLFFAVSFQSVPSHVERLLVRSGPFQRWNG
jgi:hypothetical protein